MNESFLDKIPFKEGETYIYSRMMDGRPREDKFYHSNRFLSEDGSLVLLTLRNSREEVTQVVCNIDGSLVK